MRILIEFIKQNEFESVGIFQYHDEPLAVSSKLDKKVDDSLAKERIAELTPLLEKIYEKKRTSRIGKTQTGYIMEI